MECGIGEFIVEGSPLASFNSEVEFDEEAQSELEDLYVISQYRTIDQDSGFGIRQLVDIALKALSPGVNDTTTAIVCIDYLGAILTERVERCPECQSPVLEVVICTECGEPYLDAVEYGGHLIQTASMLDGIRDTTAIPS